MAAALGLLLLLYARLGAAAEPAWVLNGLQPYVTFDPRVAQAEPPEGGGGGWDKVPDAGINIGPNTKFWLSFRNAEDPNLTKFFRVMIREAAGNPHRLSPDGATGYYSGSGPRKGHYYGGGFRGSAPANLRYDEWAFYPQPRWETVGYKTGNGGPVKIEVKAAAACGDFRLLSSGFASIPKLQFGAPGAMRAPAPGIVKVCVFPRNRPFDPSRPATFYGPSGSGQWTSRQESVDPTGNTRPLSGVVFVTDGPGLAPGETCSFNLAMQGTADLQYDIFAIEAATDSYQELSIDLRPSLTLDPATNGVRLNLPSVRGVDYVLERSSDFSRWLPVQSFAGSGQLFAALFPATNSVGIFRVSAQVATNGDITAPRLQSASGRAGQSRVVVTFSEPIDLGGAVAPERYSLTGPSGPGIILDAHGSNTMTVELFLDAPLLPAESYTLQASGIRDLAGNLMLPGAGVTFSTVEDTVAPTFVAGVPNRAGNVLTVVFSESVTAATATNLSLYYLADQSFNRLSPVRAVMASTNSVELVLGAPLSPSLEYYIGVQGVRDLANNLMVPATVRFAPMIVAPPCPGGRLVFRKSYSECQTDRRWHVVTDEVHICPDGVQRTFRVLDTPTPQPCVPNLN